MDVMVLSHIKPHIGTVMMHRYIYIYRYIDVYAVEGAKCLSGWSRFVSPAAALK